jgi:preprotein translocase subunit SecE
VARDRQRAKQRRKRQAGGSARSGSARTSAREREAQARDIGLGDDRVEDAGLGSTPAPDPLENSSSAVDEARLAEAGVPVPDPDGEIDEAQLVEADVDEADVDEADVDEADLDDAELDERAPDEVEGDLVPAGGTVDPAVAEERAEAVRSRRQRGRVITFLRHCIDELRRVQWPNRRQVGQATAVVLGFVVLAGGYLGLMDAIWKPIIEAIL